VEDVAFFRAHLSQDVRIKAAGGIHTFEQAQAMIEAGADRIGSSSLAALAKQEGL
jgi:deoxyribose-phosphate aldolase